MGLPILSAGTHVLIGDGKKAFVLFNEGTAERPSLTVETILKHPDLPTRDLPSINAISKWFIRI